MMRKIMEIEINSKGDIYDDNQSLKMIIHSPDMLNAITQARYEIGSRLKYENGLELSETHFLQKLINILYVEGLE